MDPSSIIVLITGANQGIGFETAKILLNDPSKKYHVLLGSRDVSKGDEALSALQTNPTNGTAGVIQLDVTNNTSVDEAASYITSKFNRLDILVNNAGIYSKNPIARSRLREVLDTNVVGVMSITEALLPLLKLSLEPRIVFVSSSIGSLTHASDPESKYYSKGATEYRMSKAALNMLMNQYHVALGGEGFKVLGADPGLVVTDFMDRENQRARGGVEGHVGGERVACVVRGERDADLGRVCGVYGVSPW